MGQAARVNASPSIDVFRRSIANVLHEDVEQQTTGLGLRHQRCYAVKVSVSILLSAFDNTHETQSQESTDYWILVGTHFVSRVTASKRRLYSIQRVRHIKRLWRTYIPWWKIMLVGANKCSFTRQVFSLCKNPRHWSSSSSSALPKASI